MIEWFRRLADVPGMDYPGDPRVRRSALPEHDAVPRLVSYTFDGQRHEGLEWAMKDGTTSASPASRHATTLASPPPDEPFQVHLQRLGEVLELPGTSSDYHFAIQGCVEHLWTRRRQEPGVLPEVERLCWLDIKLIEAQPTGIAYERDGKTDYPRVLAFGYLIQLYEREGFLAEALEVAERAARFGQGAEGDELRARLAQVEAEER